MQAYKSLMNPKVHDALVPIFTISSPILGFLAAFDSSWEHYRGESLLLSHITNPHVDLITLLLFAAVTLTLTITILTSTPKQIYKLAPCVASGCIMATVATIMHDSMAATIMFITGAVGALVLAYQTKSILMEDKKNG